MSVQDQFTSEELARLVAGETITKSVKGGSTTSANKNEDKVDVEEEFKPQSFTPRSSIAINSGGKVTTPRVRPAHEAEAVDVGEKITGWSGGASDRWDVIEAEKAAARVEASRLQEEEVRIQQELNPAQLLNKLNGAARIIDKLQKRVAALEKAQKAQSS